MNGICSDSKIPLHYAVINGHKDIVEKLIYADSDCSICDNEGRIPLHYAVMNGDVNMALKIIKNTYFINQRDINGKYPLQYALDHSEMFKSLVYDYGSRRQYYYLADLSLIHI